ncbi:uncharacterized protein PGTG_19909 [Puccinia graminis f. sp. tritici CRL 75-36-700-3]|uniref:Uncharacterized protein n=1 Tax=Puccinia graminis f. sp. tritici (strain CRL 75-36-700-3 / race SCCL) TaxID=418459 RepID=E3LBE5_PUCGT|nr:uncharacterized protein PGTG_19909 [Puccinia graminis f. sp. tritici CRL 75-36-700-3]EFP93870.1 hypothetical protein PGTG_19909 [Puccinia graminis f. sp. tritici CRL 75-36-700-3]
MQNIRRISSLQLDILFKAWRPSHPLSFTQVMDHLTVKLTCNLMDYLAKEIPLLFNSKWHKFLTAKLVHIINISTFAASIADTSEKKEARNQVDKMPVFLVSDILKQSTKIRISGCFLDQLVELMMLEMMKWAQNFPEAVKWRIESTVQGPL